MAHEVSASEPTRGEDRQDPAGRPARGRAIHWLALVVWSLLLALLLALLAEGVVRVRQWSKYGTLGSLAAIYDRDDKLDLRVLVPETRMGAITINRAGFRGPQIAQPKPANVVRLAFLGASTTFCAEVSSDAAVWPQRVVDLLQARFPETRFDFVNGGVPGYTVSSSRRNLRHKVAPLEPDIVVIYHATNDLSGEINALAAKGGLPAAERQAEAGWLQRRSLLVELVMKNLRVLSAQRNLAQRAGESLNVPPDQLGADFREQMRALVREAAAGGARVAVATFSTHLRPDQTDEQRKRAAVSALVYMPALSIEGLLAGYARYNTVIEEVASQERAALIGGHERIPGDPVHFVDSVHFSDRGAQVMAERVVDGLVADREVLALIERKKGR